MLDFGCGRGDLVRELLARGFDAHGVDIQPFWTDDLQGSLRAIEASYRIPHGGGDIYVPLASMIHTRWWLGLWALLGIRNEFQQGLPWRDVMARNLEYCRSGIHYVPRRVVGRMVRSIFGNVYFAKKEYIRNFNGGAARLARTTRLPGMGALIFAWREQLIYSRK